MLKFQLPIRKNTDAFPNVIQAPPVLRSHVYPPELAQEGQRIVDAHAQQINNFVLGQRQLCWGGSTNDWHRVLSLPQLTISYQALYGQETVTLDVYPTTEADADLCLMVLHNGNRVTALPMKDVYKGQFRRLEGRTLSQSGWGGDRIRCTQMCVGKEWTALVSSLQLSNNKIQVAGDTANAVPRRAAHKITSAGIDGDPLRINGSSGTVYTSRTAIRWTAADGISVSPHSSGVEDTTKQWALGSNGQVVTGDDYYYENVPKAAGSEMAPTAFGVLTRKEERQYGTWTRTEVVENFDIVYNSGGYCGTSTPPTITSKTTTDTYSNSIVVSASYNGVSLGSLTPVTTTNVGTGETFWLRSVVTDKHPIQVWTTVPEKRQFDIGSEYEMRSYAVEPYPAGFTPAGSTVNYDTTPNDSIFNTNPNSPIWVITPMDAVLKDPAPFIAANVCNGWSTQTVTTYSRIGTPRTTTTTTNWEGTLRGVTPLSFPYAYQDKEYFEILDASGTTLYTPYGVETAGRYDPVVGWWNLSDGGVLIQGYSVAGAIRIFSNGNNVTAEIAKACQCDPNEIQAMALDVPLAHIKKFA